MKPRYELLEQLRCKAEIFAGNSKCSVHGEVQRLHMYVPMEEDRIVRGLMICIECLKELMEVL